MKNILLFSIKKILILLTEIEQVGKAQLHFGNLKIWRIDYGWYLSFFSRSLEY